MLTITHKPTNKIIFLRKKKKTESERRRRYLEESGGVGNVISHSALCSDSNLVLVYCCLCLRLLHSLIPIHLFLSLTFSQQQQQQTTNQKSFSLTHFLLFVFRSKNMKTGKTNKKQN